MCVPLPVCVRDVCMSVSVCVVYMQAFIYNIFVIKKKYNNVTDVRKTVVTIA